MKRVLKWIGIVLGVVVLAAVIAVAVVSEELPEGQGGIAADDLARKLQRQMALKNWQQTGAVRFGFGGRNEHLWDRERGFARVRWADVEVLLDTRDRSGIARKQGAEVPDAEVIEDAWSRFVNDSFWLYPFAGFFDPTTKRALVELPGGEQGLLVTYASGGVTPGDSYLWHLDASGQPTAWQMWVEILPIGGVEVSWEGWERLPTGVPVATHHDFGPIELKLTDVKGAATLADLEPGDDPFAPLVKRRGSADAPSSQPALPPEG